MPSLLALSAKDFNNSGNLNALRSNVVENSGSASKKKEIVDAVVFGV